VATSREIGEQDETDFLALSATEATFAGDASAATVTRDCLRHGTASCRSALPVFDGNIRKRPAALGNEGTATAFITCDSDSINNGGTGHSAVSVFFTNRAGAPDVVVNCTLVDAVFTAIESFPKSSNALPVGVPGGGAITWTAAADNEGANFIAPAVSCAVPAGVDVPFVQFVYPEEVGALEP
jgi:hypothetical protein